MKIFIPICLAIALIGTSGVLSDEAGGTPCAAKCPSGAEIKFCPKNEKFECCAAPCVQPTCQQRDTSHIRCIRCPDECICRKGFIRLEDGGPCVRESECPAPVVYADESASNTNSTSE